MSTELCIYATGPNGQLLPSVVTVTLDDGTTASAPRSTANGRDDAHLVELPEDLQGQGSLLRVTAAGYQVFANRGITDPFAPGQAHFVLDDVHLVPEAATVEPEPTPEPDPEADPEEIVHRVYADGDFDLSTKEGCGAFTEAACTALHLEHSAWWGHIRKSGAQNQWNGHAVDAIMLMSEAGDTGPGGYDIVLNSVSADAEPTFHYAGIAEAHLWYYPAADPATATLMTELVDVTDQAVPLLHKVPGGDRLATALLEVTDRLVRARAR